MIDYVVNQEGKTLEGTAWKAEWHFRLNPRDVQISLDWVRQQEKKKRAKKWRVIYNWSSISSRGVPPFVPDEVWDLILRRVVDAVTASVKGVHAVK